MPESWRSKIRVANIMTRLEAGFNGEVDLKPEQIAAAKLLLSKVVPDLARTESKVELDATVQVSPAVGKAIESLPDSVLEKVRDAILSARESSVD